MKTIKRFITFLMPVFFMTAIMLSSCSTGSNNVSRNIPNDAAQVAIIDLNSIWEKGDLENAKDLNFVKEIGDNLKYENPSVFELFEYVLKDPSSTGIDMKDYMIVVVKKHHNKKCNAGILKIKNRKDFDEFIDKVVENGTYDMNTDYDEDENIKYYIFDDYVIAYNDEKLVFASEQYSYYSKPSADKLRQFANEFFDIEEENSLATVSAFDKFWNDRGDISIFIKAGNIIEDYGGKTAIATISGAMSEDFAKELEEMALYYTYTFEKGKLVVKYNAIDMPENIRKIGNQKFNKDLVKYMPEDVVVGGSFAINVDNLIDFFNQMNESVNPINDKADIADYTYKDLLNAFCGSFVFNVFEMNEEELLGTHFAMAFDIKDKDAVDMLITELGFDELGEGLYSYDLYDFMGFKAYLNDDVLVVANDNSVLENAVNGNYYDGMKAVADKAKKGNYAYISKDYFKHAFSGVLSYLDEESDTIDWLDHTEATIDENGFVAQTYFSDKETNSLAFILKIIDEKIKEK